MSGITPVLDTLLHQVLGKRVDTPPARELNQPVKPTSPAEAPKAVHSDSRLDARTRSPTLPETPRTPGDASPAAARSMQPGSLPPASAQTHFSPSARTIADLLVRFPAPPSVVTTSTPLMASGEIPSPASVAARLEESIRLSGLFYEAHLARWYKGELPRQQLEREPQMWRTLNFTPASTGPASAATTVAQPAAPLARQTASGAEMGGMVNARELPAENTLRSPHHPVQESLQGIVRHQLEMLVTPALRWEGDVWSGLFMALMIQLPPGHQERGHGEESDPQHDGTDQRGWRSEIDLEISGLGRLKASLWMQATRIDIALAVASDPARQHLEEGLELLRSRLAGHGFEDIRIDLQRLDEEQTP